MPATTDSLRSRPLRRRSGAALVAAVVAATSLLASCSGDRASLGSAPPSVPRSTTTTAATTTTAPTPDDFKLGPDDLLGWIATPVGNPEVYAEPKEGAKPIAIGAKTDAGAPTTFAMIGDASPGATQQVPGWYHVALRDRPNGSTGWVPADSVKVTKTPFRIFVDLGARTLRVEKDGTGVFTTLSFTMKTFAVAVSATLPRGSSTTSVLRR